MTAQTDVGPELDSLLTQAAWVHRLAQALARGDDAAQDAVQDTWEAALRHPPAPGRPRRPWLKSVLRNFVRRHARGEGRRRSREAAVAITAPEVAESPEDTLARLELHRRIAALVADLEEPFRAVVIQRYFEGRTGPEIARRLSVPEGTVRWRLREGLIRLREKLDSGGDSAAWRALVVSAGWGRRGEAPTALVFLLAAKLKLVVAGTVVLLLLAWLGWRVRPGGEPTANPVPVEDERWRTSRGHTRFLPAIPEVQEPKGTGTIQGEVRSAEGRKVAGARVLLARRTTDGGDIDVDPLAATTTDTSGAFLFRALDEGTFDVTASGGEGAAAFAPVALATAGTTRVVLRLGAAPLVLRGRVVDGGGGVLAQARVQIVGNGTGGKPTPVFTLRTADDGSYETRLNLGVYTMLASKDGYATGWARVELSRDTVQDVTLAPAATIVGRALDARTGLPVAGARIWQVGGSAYVPSVSSGPDGRFNLTGLAEGTVYVRARTSTLLGLSGPVTVSRTGGPAETTVRLTPGRTIAGHVRDPSGRPVQGAKVIAIRRGPSQEPSPPTGGATTDVAGAFTAGALLPGHYEVSAYATAWTRGKANVDLDLADRTDVVITVEPSPGARLAGVVRGPTGPVADVLIRVSNGKGFGTWARTRPDGSFSLDDLPPGDVFVRAQHVDAFASAGPLALVAGAQGSVTLTLVPAAVVTGTARLADGEPAPGTLVRVSSTDRMPVRAQAVVTNAAGWYTLGPLPAGEVTLLLARRQGAPAVAKLTLALAEGERRVGADLTVPPGEP